MKRTVPVSSIRQSDLRPLIRLTKTQTGNFWSRIHIPIQISIPIWHFPMPGFSAPNDKDSHGEGGGTC